MSPENLVIGLFLLNVIFSILLFLEFSKIGVMKRSLTFDFEEVELALYSIYLGDGDFPIDDEDMSNMEVIENVLKELKTPESYMVLAKATHDKNIKLKLLEEFKNYLAKQK